MPEKVFIAIDGSNLYFKLKGAKISSPINFDFKKFTKWLAKNRKITESIFYIGQIKEEPGNEKSKTLKRDQDRLFARLRNNGVTVKTGYILKSDGVYHEKGVDVQIAVDICMRATRNEYDTLILVSSDTDLIPAIREVRGLKKKVEYIGFDDVPSFALIRFSDSRTLLKSEDLKKF